VIAWEESGAGRPVVLVHGNTEDRRAWDTVVPLLDDDFRCIRLDLRGHGASSDAADFSAVGMVDDVAEVVRESAVDEAPLLIGHSLGAFVSTVYATQGPCSGVINIDQPLRLGDFATAIQPLREMLRGDQFAKALDIVFAELGTDALPDGVRTYLDAKHAAARQEVVLGTWDLVLDTDPVELTALGEQLLAQVRVPYLVINGAEPAPGYVEWLTASVPTATLEVFGTGGHYPHLAQPERFAARVRRFSEQAA
jgi:pimeloyl-ACP methyl ester carboxylesterase